MKQRRDGRVAIAYLGDGATSEPDFHVAMNFAGVWKVPCVFVCQNNQWAISVPLAKQTASETLAVKARAYGFPGVRVDGNDLFAVYAATRAALDRARRGDGPTLLECVTYRMGGHSSSDDPTRYRSDDEVATWRARDPVERVKRTLVKAGLWDDARERAQEESLRAEINQAVKEAEAAGPPTVETLFTDVTARLTPQLAEQRERFFEERR
jgi:pyruvate dehydrogenase E1 component alpha subunit/2-oxoisovalerate dehydrogenase E1 component alpha subunit